MRLEWWCRERRGPKLVGSGRWGQGWERPGGNGSLSKYRGFWPNIWKFGKWSKSWWEWKWILTKRKKSGWNRWKRAANWWKWRDTSCTYPRQDPRWPYAWFHPEGNAYGGEHRVKKCGKCTFLLFFILFSFDFPDWQDFCQRGPTKAWFAEDRAKSGEYEDCRSHEKFDISRPSWSGCRSK